MPTMPISRRSPRSAPPLQEPGGQHPYPSTPQDDCPAGDSHAPAPAADRPQPQEQARPHSAPPAEPVGRGPGPVGQWWQAFRTDRAIRKERGGGRWWLMRWMREQPTSVADHLDYYLHQSQERADGRRGWGLQTAIPVINLVHAAFHIVFGLSVALLMTLACYALAWMCQRPGRTFLLAVAVFVIHTNLATWLAP
jgi:hypothetical protein